MVIPPLALTYVIPSTVTRRKTTRSKKITSFVAIKLLKPTADVCKNMHREKIILTIPIIFRNMFSRTATSVWWLVFVISITQT